MPDETNTTPVSNGVGTTLPPVMAGAAEVNQSANQNAGQDAAAMAKAATAAATRNAAGAEGAAGGVKTSTRQANDPIVKTNPASVTPKDTQRETQQTGVSAVQKAVLQNIQEAKNVLVALSADPSVDEMAAAIGLTLFLDNMGKRATAIYSGETPNALEFLKPEEMFEPSADTLQDFVIALNKEKADHLRYKLDGDFVKIYITPYRAKIAEKDLEFSYGDYNVDLVLALDVANGADLDAALREHGRIMHDAVIINITTGKPGKFGEIEWSDGRASSISEMIARLLYGMGGEAKIEKEEATAFLTGIVAATNRFSNARTVPETMQIASKLMISGANQQLISRHITPEIDNEIADLGAGQKKEEPVVQEAPEEKEEVDPTKLEISHRGSHRKSIDLEMEKEGDQAKQKVTAREEDGKVEEKDVKAENDDEVKEEQVAEVKEGIQKEEVSEVGKAEEKEEDKTSGVNSAVDSAGSSAADSAESPAAGPAESIVNEPVGAEKDTQEQTAGDGELMDDLKAAAASLATAGTETVPNSNKPLKIESDAEEMARMEEAPEKTEEAIMETNSAEATPVATEGSGASSASETSAASAVPEVSAAPAANVASATPAAPVTPAEAVFKLPELNTDVLPKDKGAGDEGFVSDKPEKVIQPTNHSGGNSEIGGEKYEKMLEDALEGKSGVNPVVAQAPAVPSKPEINGVPQINYMPMPGDTVLPPPPTPPIGAGEVVPPMPTVPLVLPATPAAAEAPKPAAPTTPTPANPGAFRIPGT